MLLLPASYWQHNLKRASFDWLSGGYRFLHTMPQNTTNTEGDQINPICPQLIISIPQTDISFHYSLSYVSEQAM